LDCKAVVKIGPFSRGGKNRIEQKASDHDFEPEEKLVSFGVFIPKLCESHFWFSIGPVTADFMIDRLEELWMKLNKRFPNLNRLVINADNGPEGNGQRTRWLQRLVEFSDAAGIKIELAHYPPYHSKYNPVERLWGVLENHWRGPNLYRQGSGPRKNHDLPWNPTVNG
jgi:transposase